MTRARPFAAAVFAALLSILPAAAGPLTEQAQQAETELNAGNAVKALASIEAAFNSVWDATPLGFSEALFVTGKPAGFGVYDARATNVFRPDEGHDGLRRAVRLRLRARRRGVQDRLRRRFRTPDGQGSILTSQEGFAVLDMASRRRNKEFQVFITYSFKGLKAGDYVLVTKLRDRNSAKAGSFELPFTVASTTP